MRPLYGIALGRAASRADDVRGLSDQPRRAGAAVERCRERPLDREVAGDRNLDRFEIVAAAGADLESVRRLSGAAECQPIDTRLAAERAAGARCAPGGVAARAVEDTGHARRGGEVRPAGAVGTAAGGGRR